MAKIIDMRELAGRLRLSVSTVSKALNGRPDINEKTRERVLAAAARYNFVPHPAARRLRTQSSDMIGFVLSAPQNHFAHPFFLDMLAGINEELEGTRFQVVVTSARSVEQELDCFKSLVERVRVDAMLFARTRRDDPRVAYLLDRGVPFVTFGRSDSKRPFAFVDIDHTVVGRDATARFVALGHRRIALLNTPGYLMFSEHHIAGYRQALNAAGLPWSPALYVEDTIGEEGGARAAHRLLGVRDPPTGIVCGNDLMALGAMRAIRERGQVPGVDVGVIGTDDHPIGKLVAPALTTFSAETHRAGRRMVKMLQSLLDGTPAKELQEVWSPEMIVRSSDGPPRRTAELQSLRRRRSA